MRAAPTPLPELIDARGVLRAAWRHRASDERMEDWEVAHAEQHPDCLPTYIYVVQVGEDGPVKVGISDRPEARFRNLQTANHEELNLITYVRGCKHLEKAIHKGISEHLIHLEWFRYEGCVVETVEELALIEERERDYVEFVSR